MIGSERGKLNIVGLIPARGGSKGVPRKNTRMLAGKPLIAWTIEAALLSACFDRVVVSTDDTEVACLASDFGAEVPFLRPVELAQDETPDYPVFEHAVSWLLREDRTARNLVIVWLRPTCPLRTPTDIDCAVDLLIKSGADSVRSICPAEHHPYWMKRITEDQLHPFITTADENKYYQRQLLPPAYRLNGAVEAIRAANALQYGNMYGRDLRGYLMPRERSIDIDSELDLVIAEAVMRSSHR